MAAASWWWVGFTLASSWFAGVLWLRWAWRDASYGSKTLLLGYGYIVGALAGTLLLRLQVLWSNAALNWLSAFFLIGLIVVIGLLLNRKNTASLPSLRAMWHRVKQIWREQPNWQRYLFIALLAWLGWRFTGLALEIWWRPLYPWDAWVTWAVRPKVWAELGQWVPFVDPPRWVADPTGSAYTIEAWNYPATVPSIALWPVLAGGSWNETAANLPWLGAALALALGFYGQVRWWGGSPLVSLIFTGLLWSLPLFNTHVALAGYADLWMSAVFSLTAIAFLQWVRTGDPAQGRLALLLALACPLIKLEGTVWVAMFIPALIAVWLRRWALWVLIIAGTLGVAVWWAAGGVAGQIPGFGAFELRPNVISIPYLGRFNLGYRGTWGPLLKNFFVLGNWHLFWYLALGAFAVAITQWRRERWRRVYLLFIASCLAMLFLLFFFTDAQRWAEQYTSINRVFLHFVPALLFWIMTVFIPPKTSPAPESMPEVEPLNQSQAIAGIAS